MQKQISHYKILSEIDSGGMAIIYLALDTNTNTKVAIKVLKEEVSDKEKILERFAQEGLLKLNHPNIVKILDAGTYASNPYIVMEYIDGVDLEAYIKKYGQLSLNKSIDIFRQLLNALSYIHARGIIHRDIKPRNVLIGKNGVAKLTDFGIAKSLSSQIKTSTGSYLGAPAYSSPEQLDGKSIDFRTDIYSLGITFYESLSGINPFWAKSVEEMIKKKFFDLPVSITSYRNDIPPYILMILDKCLSRYPNDRFKSAGEILKIFDTQLTPTTFKIIENAEDNTDNITYKKKSSKKLWVLLSALSVIAIFSIIFIFVYFFSIKPSGVNESIESASKAVTNEFETTGSIDSTSTTVTDSSTSDKVGKDTITDSESSADSLDTSYSTTTENPPGTSTETTELPEKSQENLTDSFEPNPLGNLFIFSSYDDLRGEDIFIIMDDEGNIRNTIYFDEYVAKNEAGRSYTLASAHSPFLSSDGNYIICQEEGYYTVVLLDINNKTFKTFKYIDEKGELSGGSMIRDPSFSPDDKFALLSGMNTKSTNFGLQVCLFKVNEFEKANLEILTEFGDWINDARFSADGTKIVFSTDLSEIFIIDLAAEHKIMNDNVIQFTKLFGYKGSHPTFSPDGEKIVFEYYKSNDSIVIINIDGTGFKKIYDIHGYQSPSFTSDGKRIIFSAPDGKPPYYYNDIFSIDLDGNNLINLTNSKDIDDKDAECIY